MTDYIDVRDALEELRQGNMIILEDASSRENEGDLVVAAEKVTPEIVNFMLKYARGLVCMPMSQELIEKLELPMMVKNNRSKQQTAFTVSIGAAEGITTGISAFDRANTVQAAIADDVTPQDIVSPGHIFPLQAAEGGVLVRPGHTEASVDLARLAGLKQAAVICEIMNDDGTMARADDLARFAKTYNIKRVAVSDLITYRINNESLIEEEATAKLPLHQHGEFEMRVFQSKVDGVEHVALISGEIKQNKPTLVRLHSECLTGEVFGSARCDCGWQLQTALAKISEQGGVLIYARQEGRGIGLINKIRAYALQDEGLDTVEANHKLGFPADQRDYGIAAQILKKLGVNKISLMTNNPRKVENLSRYHINVVGRESIEVSPTAENITYLRTKRDKLGHLLSLEQEQSHYEIRREETS